MVSGAALARAGALAWNPDVPPLRVLSYKEYEDLLDVLNYGDDEEIREHLYSLRQLGRGISRRAYLLSVADQPPTVLKVALDDPYFQNETEVWCAIGLRSDLLPEIYDWGPSDDHVRWLEVEYLQPAHAPDFLQLTGLERWQLESILSGPAYRAEDRLRAAAEEAPKRRADFLHALADLIGACNLAPGDLQKGEHWGVDAHGRLKLIDFGYRREPARLRHPAVARF